MEKTGENIYKLAKQHLKEKYQFKIRVPKHNPNWKGPWDCAELVSWTLYQITKEYYGCRRLKDNTIDAYTGSYQKYAETKGYIITVKQAKLIQGAILLKIPNLKGKYGHIGISNGTGKVIEAKRSKKKVIYTRMTNKNWTYGILIPEFTYSSKLNKYE